jgi:predicted O-methyltransferase YrrM
MIRATKDGLLAILGYRPPARAMSIRTCLTEEEKLALYRSALTLPKGSVALEVGSYLGASACIVGSALRRRSGKMHCVDTWQNQANDEPERDTWPEFSQNVRFLGETIIPHRGFSVEIAKKNPLDLDFLFVDGDHSDEAVDADFRSWVPMVKSGGIVAAHDIGWADGVCKAIEKHLRTRIVSQTVLPNLLICTVR